MHQIKQPNPQAIISRAKLYGVHLRKLLIQRRLDSAVRPASQGARYMTFRVRLADPTKLDDALKISRYLALSAGVNVIGVREGAYVRYDFSLPSTHWTTIVRDRHVAGSGIGIMPGGEVVNLNLDNATYHQLVAGYTGSGKSTLIKTMLCAIGETEQPDDLDLFIIDPKGDYLDFDNMAHLGTRIARTPEEIARLITHVHNIYQQREAEKNFEGKRFIVFIDEAHHSSCLGTASAGFNNESLAMVQDFVRTAGAFRGSAFVCSQRPLREDLPNILTNLGDRWVLRVNDATASYQATGLKGMYAHTLSQGGDCYHVAGADVHRMQVAMVTQASLDKLPRKEQITEIPDIDVPRYEPERKETRGAPRKEITAADVVKYLTGGAPGRGKAYQELGLTQTTHRRVSRFADEFVIELKKPGVIRPFVETLKRLMKDTNA